MPREEAEQALSTRKAELTAKGKELAEAKATQAAAQVLPQTETTSNMISKDLPQFL
jgi:hypothetical protein